MTAPIPDGDPASCCAAAADLAACARLLRDRADDDPLRGGLVAQVERLASALAELGQALSLAQSARPGGARTDRARLAALSGLGRARARLRRVCEEISPETGGAADRGSARHRDARDGVSPRRTGGGAGRTVSGWT